MAINLTYDPSDDPVAIEAQQAHDAEALAIGEQLEQEQESLLAGKYRNAEELEQAYIELQRKFGSRDQDEETPEVDDGTQEEEEIEENPTVDLLYNIREELDSNGELSEETLASLEQVSSQDLVQTYLRLRAEDPPQEQSPASAELTPQQVSEIQNAVGGEAPYQQLVGWAAENFSPAEIDAFDSVIESGNMGAIGLALQALYYRYTDSMGYEGEMIQGKPAASRDVFRSQAEVVRAMSDPRYDNDPAYRQDIFNKLDRSDLQF
jgi:hypothetical protein